MFRILKVMIDSMEGTNGPVGTSQWADNWRIGASIPQAATILQQMIHTGELGRWMVRNSWSAQNGKELTVQLFRRDMYNVELEPCGVFDAMMINWMDAQGQYYRGNVPFEFEAALRFVADGAGTIFSFTGTEHIDPRGQAFHHGRFRCQSRIWEIQDFAGWLAMEFHRR